MKWQVSNGFTFAIFCEIRLLGGCVEIVVKVPTTKFVLKISVPLSNTESVSTTNNKNNKSDVLEDEFLDFERFCVDFILLTMSKRFEFVSSQLAQAQKETASHIFCVKDDGTQASFFFLSFYSILR